jgi:hypothetical protein
MPLRRGRGDFDADKRLPFGILEPAKWQAARAP